MRRIALVACFLWACGGDDGGGDNRPVTVGGDRPADLKHPPMLTDGKQYPLVMVLHGYSASGLLQSAYFGAPTLVSSDAAFVIAPDGLVDSLGNEFWNADPLCCDDDGRNPDDVAYLGGILDELLASDWPIDPDRVYLIGHSNGGFMSYRMACERADIIAAIAPLAGLASSQPAMCNPSRPVAVLHMHGTEDEIIPFTAGGFGAEASTQQWAGKNGCAATRTAGPDMDLERNIDGAETQTATLDGCPADGEIEQWSITGAGHVPVFGSGFTTTWFDWLQAHARAHTR